MFWAILSPLDDSACISGCSFSERRQTQVEYFSSVSCSASPRWIWTTPASNFECVTILPRHWCGQFPAHNDKMHDSRSCFWTQQLKSKYPKLMLMRRMKGLRSILLHLCHIKWRAWWKVSSRLLRKIYCFRSLLKTMHAWIKWRQYLRVSRMWKTIQPMVGTISVS